MDVASCGERQPGKVTKKKKKTAGTKDTEQRAHKKKKQPTPSAGVLPERKREKR